MTKLTDGKRTVEISMMVWMGTCFAPDWSNDFFDVGLLSTNDDGAYIVNDVGYCIDQAREWMYEAADNTVYVSDINLQHDITSDITPDEEIPLF